MTQAIDPAAAIDALACDYCAEPTPAETIHLLPSAGTSRSYHEHPTAEDIWKGTAFRDQPGAAPEAVRFACADHDPGGYWFYADAWVADSVACTISRYAGSAGRPSSSVMTFPWVAVTTMARLIGCQP